MMRCDEAFESLKEDAKTFLANECGDEFVHIAQESISQKMYIHVPYCLDVCVDERLEDPDQRFNTKVFLPVVDTVVTQMTERFH
jgi:hypothetical protein